MARAVAFPTVVSQVTHQPKNYSLLHDLWTRCKQKETLSTQPSACSSPKLQKRLRIWCWYLQYKLLI